MTAAGEWDPGVEGRGERGRRSRPAFDLELPAIPTVLAAEDIDDPDVEVKPLSLDPVISDPRTIGVIRGGRPRVDRGAEHGRRSDRTPGVSA